MPEICLFACCIFIVEPKPFVFCINTKYKYVKTSKYKDSLYNQSVLTIPREHLKLSIFLFHSFSVSNEAIKTLYYKNRQVTGLQSTCREFCTCSSFLSLPNIERAILGAESSQKYFLDKDGGWVTLAYI